MGIDIGCTGDVETEIKVEMMVGVKMETKMEIEVTSRLGRSR